MDEKTAIFLAAMLGGMACLHVWFIRGLNRKLLRDATGAKLRRINRLFGAWHFVGIASVISVSVLSPSKPDSLRWDVLVLGVHQLALVIGWLTLSGRLRRSPG